MHDTPYEGCAIAGATIRPHMPRRLTYSVVFSLFSLTPAAAMAQDAGVDGTNPALVVRAALHGAVPRISRTVRQRVAPSSDVVIPLRPTRGECLEVMGYASGAARVSAEVVLRDVPVASEVVFTNSTGQVGRGRFCASLGGVAYELRVHAEGPAWWSLVVLTVPPATADASVAVDATAPATPVVNAPNTPAQPPAAQFPVGGAETDYVAGQIRSIARSHSLGAPLNAATRWTLDTNAFREVSAMVPSGQCVELAASGVPSVGDLVLELYDPTGNRMAQDATHQATESARYCPAYAGIYRARVRVFSGAGLVAAQLFSAARQ